MTRSARGSRSARLADAGQDADGQAGARRAPHPQVGRANRRRPRCGPARTPGSAHRRQHHVRGGLDRQAVVGADDGVDQRRPPRARASVRSVGSRSSLVATATFRPSRTEPAEQRRQIRQRVGQRDRVRRVPGASQRPSASASDSPASTRTSRVRSRSRAIGVAASPPWAGPCRSPRRSRASRTAAASTVAAGGLPQVARRGSTAQPLHIASNSMSVPSLSKMTRSMPSSGSVTPRRRPPRSGDGRRARRRARSRPRAGTRPSRPRRPSGTFRCGSLNVSSEMLDGGSPSRPSPRLEPDADDRAEEVDVVDRAVQAVRAFGSRSPSSMPSGRSASVTFPSAAASVDDAWPSGSPGRRRDSRPADASIDPGADEVERAHERGHERRRREVVDLGRRADLLDPALAHDHDAVGQRERLLLVVGHVDRGDAELALDARISLRRTIRILASSADRGSSRSRTWGSMASARASATRCCWPPDICYG